MANNFLTPTGSTSCLRIQCLKTAPQKNLWTNGCKKYFWWYGTNFIGKSHNVEIVGVPLSYKDVWIWPSCI